MFNLFLILLSSLVFIFNSYYSTYGVLLLGMVCTLQSFKKQGQFNILQLLASITLVFAYILSGVKSLSLEPTILLMLLVVNISQLKLKPQVVQQISASITILSLIFAVFQFVSQDIAYGSFINIYDTKQIFPNAFASLNLILLAINSKQLRVANLLNIFLSKSRFAIAISMMYLLYESITKRGFKLRYLTVVSLIAVLSVFSISKTNQSTEFNSIDQRMEHWINTPKLLKLDHTLLFGYGPHSFEYIYQTVQRIPENQAPHSHNIVLNLLVENGMLFVIIFGLLLIKQSRGLNSKYKTALVLFLIHNLVDLNIQFPLTVLVLLLLFGASQTDHKYTLHRSIKHLPIALNLLSVSILVLSLNNNFVVSHKDQLLRDFNTSKNAKLIETYIKQNPLDKNQLLKLDEKKYIKDAFLQKPFDVNNLELLLKHYPKISLYKKWIDNYKNWYLSHSKQNLNYINEKGTVTKLRNIFKDLDPEFSDSL